MLLHPRALKLLPCPYPPVTQALIQLPQRKWSRRRYKVSDQLDGMRVLLMTSLDKRQKQEKRAKKRGDSTVLLLFFLCPLLFMACLSN
jgi:hypothetical protein